MNIKETLKAFNTIDKYNYTTLKKLCRKTGKNTIQIIKGYENYEKIYNKIHGKYYGNIEKQILFLNNLKKTFC